MGFHQSVKLLFLTASLCVVHVSVGSKIDGGLLVAPESKGVLVSFTPNTLPIIQKESLSAAKFTSRADKISHLVSVLEENAKSQTSVQEFLTARGIEFKSIWISNQISVKNLSLSTLEEIADLPSVSLISEDLTIPLDDPFPEVEDGVETKETRQNDNVKEWGIQKIRAEEALHLITSANIAQTEVRVGIIDSGVRRTHEALNANYYGAYGWMDPYNLTTDPTDADGHGTHVTGTILGTRGIGVYSNAKYMSCRGCFVGTCAYSSLLLCGQYILCPTLPDGSQRDCTRAPHIVSNSWGGNQNQTWLDPVIQAWHDAGIIPVFSAGNAGPACNSVLSPGDRNVIAVGSTTINDTLSWFSSLGRSVDGTLKPEVVAPGHEIRSAWFLTDNSYAIASGTSMACPHVTGIIAIMKAIRPDITYDQVKAFLMGGTDTNTLTGNGTTCGGIPDNVFPNNVFGSGRVNAFKIINSLIHNLDTETTTEPVTTTTTTQNPNSSLALSASFLLMFLLSFTTFLVQG